MRGACAYVCVCGMGDKDERQDDAEEGEWRGNHILNYY